jgi:hypothetical protein
MDDGGAVCTRALPVALRQQFLRPGLPLNI